MGAGPVVAIFFREAKVDEEKLVAVTTNAHEEIVRLDVSVDEVLVVNKLNPSNHLKVIEMKIMFNLPLLRNRRIFFSAFFQNGNL